MKAEEACIPVSNAKINKNINQPPLDRKLCKTQKTNDLETHNGKTYLAHQKLRINFEH